MSKLVFTLFLTFSALFTFDASAFHVDLTLKSVDGCKFRIVGEVTLTWTGGFSSFTGTVTASGGDGCPNGTWNFLAGPGAGSGNDNHADNPRVRSYVFQGGGAFVDIIKREPATMKRFITKMEQAASNSN